MSADAAVGNRLGQLIERRLNLRSGIERDRLGDLGSRRCGRRRDDQAGGNCRIDAAVELAHVELAGQLFSGNPGRDEVVLDHRHPAVIGLGIELGFAFFDVAKGNLLVFVLFGINRRSGEGADHAAFACGRFGIALQLIVGMRRDFLLAAIIDFVADTDQIAATSKGIDLADLDAVDGRSDQSKLNRLGIGA